MARRQRTSAAMCRCTHVLGFPLLKLLPENSALHAQLRLQLNSLRVVHRYARDISSGGTGPRQQFSETNSQFEPQTVKPQAMAGTL